VLAIGALALALIGCTDGGETRAAAPTQTAWAEQTTGPAGAGASSSFDAHASAAANKAVFDSAIRKVLRKDPQAKGDAVAAALKSAGFPMTATQVSASTTSANLEPGSISVGVKVGKACLVGQWGSAVDGYQSAVAPVLRAGGCLVGGIPAVG
jgi:hypothetical protein